MCRIDTARGAKITIGGRELDYFCGTGYLGMQTHPALIRAANLAMEQYGFGAETSRIGYGANSLLSSLEKKAAEYFEVEEAVVFSSGYLGNAILLQGLSRQYDVIFADKNSHYSVFDAAAIAQKPLKTFNHRDVEDLESQLRTGLKPRQRPLVISDGVFPVTGEVAPLQDYDKLLENYGRRLICVDDAHAIGVLGRAGKGTLDFCGVSGEGRYHCGTMSKAFGTYGGVITGSKVLVDYLK